MAMTKRIQLMTNFLRSSLSAMLGTAALNNTMVKIAIPAQETIALRMMPKTTKTPPSQVSNRLNGKTGEPTPMNRP